MSIFEKKRALSRLEFRQALRKSSPYIPGTGGRAYSQKERVEMEKKLFGREYGSHISKDDFRKGLRKLSGERLRTKTSSDRLRVDRQMRFLKKLGGI